MPHVVLHEAALDRDGLGLLERDGGDVWVVDGRSGTAVAVVDQRADAPDAARLVLTRDGRAFLPDGSELEVTRIPREVDVFDRVRGVFETDVLADRTVAIIGLGSGGSFIARELCKAGVGGFVLVDHDRLEPGNVCRHECGLSDVGRLKVKAIRDVIVDRNPAARVSIHPWKVGGGNAAATAALIADVDMVICATDNRASRLIVNRACVQADRTALYGAVFRRAYGGQVLLVIPGLTPCYQCFVSGLPDIASDHEIASDDAAAAIAYSDRPVAVEPGLSSDLLPIGLLMVKLAILQLLAGRQTTLAPLREDLVAPLYLWINRREPGTDYAQLKPLRNNVEAMTILRWYGIFLPRHPHCPVCGDFERALLARAGLEDLSPDDLDLSDFAGS